MANFNQYQNRGKKYNKHNYVEVLESITPKLYTDQDIKTFGQQVSPLDLILKTHIDIANNFNTIFNISATVEGSALRDFSGIASLFIKQNNPLKLDSFDFNRLVLKPLGVSLSNFNTSSDFKDYVVSSLLPNITLNSPNYLFGFQNKAQAHDYLIDTLSWLYFLNIGNNSSYAYQPSGYVADLLINKIFYGETITLNDGIKGLENFIWRNYGVCSLFQNLVPTPFVSSTDTYSSGLQSLTKLETLIDVLYSPLASDKNDVRVKNAFDDYISIGEYPQNLESAGAFYKLLKSVAFGMFDINDQINSILFVHSIDDCPDKYLPYLADIIGWELIGPNPDKWRMQLKNAVAIYKAKGTKRALELVTDTLFGINNSDSEVVNANLKELWESYVPNLLYYALVTECPFLESFETWRLDLANSLGISDYSQDSMDTNVRFVVDDIIKRAIGLFPDRFYLGNSIFGTNLVATGSLFDDQNNFMFNYRGRTVNFPPWEMEKYYVECSLTKEMLNYFYDRLVCLGVRKDFADSWYDYIFENVLSSEKESPRNGFLFFTANNEIPPNYDNILKNLDQNKYKYLPLWNGKSSHFKLGLDVGTFSINTDELQFGSYTGLDSVTRAVNLFTPAHAIPLLDINATDFDIAGYNEIICESVLGTPDDLFLSGVVAGYEISGMNMSSLGRVFKRTDVDLLADQVYASTVPISNIKRNSQRRRSLKNLIPKDGWYFRDGFNMPPYLAPSTVQNYNNYLPLGYIPSSGKYESIPDYNSLPQVYVKCEDLTSNSVINGVTTSATFPCRGISYSVSSCAAYSTRSDVDPIVPVIFNQIQLRAYRDSEHLASGGPVYYIDGDPVRNSANTSAGPNSQEDFFGFEFNKGIHAAYKKYVSFFSGHDLSEGAFDLSTTVVSKISATNILSLLEDTAGDGSTDLFLLQLNPLVYKEGPKTIINKTGGKNIISHAYGPILYNGFFDIAGSAATSYNLVNTTLVGEEKIIDGYYTQVMSTSGAASGTYIASTLNSLYVQVPEFRNPHILSGIEFVDSSGLGDNRASFALYSLSPSDAREGQENFSYYNSLLKVKSPDIYSFSRVRFNLKQYADYNSFLPEHLFDLRFRYFVSREPGSNFGANIDYSIGGGLIGIWIHTSPENGYTWTYTPEGVWKIHSVSDLTIEKVQLELSHLNSYPFTTLPQPVTSSLIPCINQVSSTSSHSFIGLENIPGQLFKEFKLTFNTFNPPICIPNYYSPQGTSVHRTDQEYVIEVFFRPTLGSYSELLNGYALYDSIIIRDLDLVHDVSGYTPFDLLKTFRFFTDIADSRASRNSTISSGTFETSGGSRLSYRYHPDWGTQSKSAGFNQYTQIDMKS